MAYNVKGNVITLTRGDSLFVKVDIYYNGEAYQPEEGDVVRFALKHKSMTSDKGNYTDSTPIFTKTIPNDTLILQIDPLDTKALPFGDYVYDVQITFADGTVDTFITASTFRLTPEVD